jgi:hypothetical protein
MGEDVREPRLRIDDVELAAGDERVDRRCPPAAFVRTGEGPVLTADRDSLQLTPGSVVRDAQATVVGKRLSAA